MMWHELQNPGCPVTSTAATVKTPAPASATRILPGQPSRRKARNTATGAHPMHLMTLPIISPRKNTGRGGRDVLSQAVKAHLEIRVCNRLQRLPVLARRFPEFRLIAQQVLAVIEDLECDPDAKSELLKGLADLRLTAGRH